MRSWDIVGEPEIVLSTLAMVVVSDFHNKNLIIWQYQIRFTGSWALAASHARQWWQAIAGRTQKGRRKDAEKPQHLVLDETP
jgi:hypothetical protein